MFWVVLTFIWVLSKTKKTEGKKLHTAPKTKKTEGKKLHTVPKTKKNEELVIAYCTENLDLVG